MLFGMTDYGLGVIVFTCLVPLWNHPMHIRLEIPADIPAIHALTQAAFLDAPHTQHTEHHIVDALREAGQLSLSLVAHDAHDEHAIIGHIAFSPVHLMHADANGNADQSRDTLPAGWYGLGPVSVLPSRQRQGIGSKLITHAPRFRARHALS